MCLDTRSNKLSGKTRQIDWDKATVLQRSWSQLTVNTDLCEIRRSHSAAAEDLSLPGFYSVSTCKKATDT